MPLRRFTLYGRGVEPILEPDAIVPDILDWTYRAAHYEPRLEDKEVIAVVEELPVRVLISTLEKIANGECRDYANDARKALEEYHETA